MFYKCLKPILFQMDPERAHNFAASAMRSPLFSPYLSLNQSFSGFQDSTLATDLCGIPLTNPIGLAAGFDKNASMYPALHRLGFAFVEVGTVTRHAQAGNPKPRLFRLPTDEALINRMGFNNDGADVIAGRLQEQQARVPLGGNIGKSKVTPLEEAQDDYAYSFQLLKPWVDYFVVNVSSPNTPNLRKLQERGPLKELLLRLSELNTDPKLPLLLKIAPDLNFDQLGEIVEVVGEAGIDGVIATNTTISRDGLKTPENRVEAIGAGGLSGKPVREMSTEVIRFLRQHLPEKVTVVGVGGIHNGADAYEKILNGARCLQIYTGFVYGGPNTVYRICRELSKLLKRDGYTKLSDAVGAAL
jgi:dihydroorotate dehydrogenase